MSGLEGPCSPGPHPHLVDEFQSTALLYAGSRGGRGRQGVFHHAQFLVFPLLLFVFSLHTASRTAPTPTDRPTAANIVPTGCIHNVATVFLHHDEQRPYGHQYYAGEGESIRVDARGDALPKYATYHVGSANHACSRCLFVL